MNIRNLLSPITHRRFSESRFDEYIYQSREVLDPVFFLSTGRCGTKLLTEILQSDKNNRVLHNYSPELIRESKIIYEIYPNSDPEAVDRLAQCVYLLARGRIFWELHLGKQRMMETNNKVTFFAPALSKFFSKAKFVHIYRHPGEFIRSGLSRNWYQGHPYDFGRIVPKENTEAADQWVKWSDYEKIAWLWNETNLFIENFLKTLPANKFLSVNFNKLDAGELTGILEFTGSSHLVEKLDLEKQLSNPRNVQKHKPIGEYTSWSDDKKESVLRIVSKLMNKYDYQF